MGVIVMLATHGRARAWIYPEHRQIGVEAWSHLRPESRNFYAALWEKARSGYGAGLCEAPVSAGHPAPGPSPDRSPCIDLPAWPAIAGDHSCSPDELIEQTLPARFVHAVAEVSEAVSQDLATAEDTQARENIWITSNLRLQDVDDAYVTRAGANNAHFLLPITGDRLDAFIRHSTVEGAPLNALGLYVQYHAAALRLAAALGPGASRATGALARQVLALEAYALHFLQDMFASGHVAGTWGDVAIRKGTHDYYCAHGYSTTSWAGKTLIMFGDAHIRPADLERSAALMAASMEQLALAAASGTGEPPDPGALAVGALDSCNRLEHPRTIPLDAREQAAIEAVLRDTARPGHGPESVSWPRYRADFGPFVGLASSIAIAGAFTGYGGSKARPYSEFAVGLRLGYGLEGVVASMNTGTMYLQLGLVRQGEQVDYCIEGCELDVGSRALPRVPSRGGLNVGLRVPFWLVPFDLLVLAPILAVASPSDLTRVAIRAASGGLIPWQRSFATSFGHFELVAGREVSATFFGLAERSRVLTYFDQADPRGNLLGEAGFRSIRLYFPALEYTPLRTFAQTLSMAIQLQLGYAIDVPIDTVRYMSGGLPGPAWGPAHTFILKLNVDARGYL